MTYNTYHCDKCGKATTEAILPCKECYPMEFDRVMREQMEN